MKAELRGAPKIVHAPGHSISDVATKCVHIVNLASVRELERVVGRKVDPLRFRANIYLDGLPPWSEFAWLDSDIGIGPTRLEVFARTQRCAATNVDPGNGARDMAIPAELTRTWGHQDFGIYAKVVAGGVVVTGAPVAISNGP
jgi:MOSC domain-containing protein